MTTQTWTSGISHTTDTEFRAWGSELAAKFAAAGLVKTSDTGQINWSTVTRPAANNAAGYEIWRFNDALQATAPIYLKIEYGSGGATSIPMSWMTAGGGSTGAGALTGTVSDTAQIFFSSLPQAGNFPSYLCVTAGFVGLLWKSGAASSTGYGFFAVSRTFNTSGAATGDGYLALWGAINVSTVCLAQSVRTISTAEKYTSSRQYSVVPHQVVASNVGADFQVYPVFGISPRAYVLPTLATVVASEVPQGTTFSVAMVGVTSRTMISVGSGFRPIAVSTGPGLIGTYGFAMLWE